MSGNNCSRLEKLADRRSPLSKTSGILESVRELKNGPLIPMPTNDLNTDGQAIRREAAGNRDGRVSGDGDVKTGFHPIDIGQHFHPLNLGDIRLAHVERKHLRDRQNEVLVFFEEHPDALIQLCSLDFGPSDLKAA